MFRLPNLPNVGYATRREKALSDNIMDFMRQIERDRPKLLTIVCEGRERWNRVAGDIWRGYRISEDHQAINAIFSYLELLACPAATQAELLRYPKNVLKWQAIMRQAMPDIEAEREALQKAGVTRG